jgi:hypothetical protein
MAETLLRAQGTGAGAGGRSRPSLAPPPARPPARSAEHRADATGVPGSFPSRLARVVVGCNRCSSVDLSVVLPSGAAGRGMVGGGSERSPPGERKP